MQRELVRLSQLTRLIPGASKKALRAALRNLELARIISRRDLSDLVLHLAEWGEVIEAKEDRA